MTTLRLSNFIPGIAWFFIVLVLTCMPGDDLPMTGSWFTKIPYFDKWVHLGLFAMLSFCFMMPVARLYPDKGKRLAWIIRIGIIASVWGLAIEFIQKYLVVGRSFDLLDWAADSVGVFLTFLLVRKRFLPGTR